MQTSPRSIPQIDRDLNALHKQLRGLEKIDTMSAESWQDAWDKHPDLYERERALWSERGHAQQIRDEKRAKQVAASARRDAKQQWKESAAKFKARMIREAASEEMLAALNSAFVALQGDCGYAFRDLHPATWRRMEAAITKARGE